MKNFLRGHVIASSAERGLARFSSANWRECKFGGVVKTFDKVTKKNLAVADKLVDKQIEEVDLPKGTVYAVDCGVEHYLLVSVEEVATKGVPVRKFVVVVDEENSPFSNREVLFDSFVEAREYAVEQAFGGENVSAYIQVRTFINDCPNMFSVKGNRKKLKNRPRLVPKGSILVENHLYIFFGRSAE